MRGVTVRTHRCDYESGLCQSLAVDSATILLNNISRAVFVSYRGDSALSVTLTAQVRHVHRESHRILIGTTQHIVLSVTIYAMRCSRVASIRELAVSADIEVHDRIGVADGAIHFRNHRSARPYFVLKACARMALRARRRSVNGAIERLRVHIHRYRITVYRANNVLSTVTLETVFVGDSLVIIDLSYFMRRVTVYADRHLIRFLLPQLTTNYLPMNLLNSSVALLARVCDVVAMYARFGIGVIENIVRSMAIDAYRCYSQALSEQAEPVNALRIVSQNAVFGYVVFLCDFGAFFVARSAHKRNVKLGDLRLIGGLRENVMRSVAIAALRCQPLTLLDEATVEAVVVNFRDIFVTEAAVHELEFVIMWYLGVHEVHVTVYALELAVRGCPEPLQVDMNRNLSAVPFTGKLRVLVTHHTVFGGLRLKSPCGQKEEYDRNEQDAYSRNANANRFRIYGVRRFSLPFSQHLTKHTGPIESESSKM